MKKYINKYIGGIAIMVTIFMAACEKPEIVEFSFDGTTDALFDTKLGGRVDVFHEAVKKAGYQDRLSGSETYTYLAPTNDAMILALESGGFTSVEDASEEFLQGLVDDHMFSGSILAADLSKSRITTLSGEMVYVSTEGGISFNAQSKVSGVTGSSNNISTNGVVHIVDFPLINFPEMSISELVSGAANADTLAEFTTLLAALEATELDAVLANTENLYTVLAPTDAAFAESGLTAANIGDVDVDVLTEILLYHVLPDRFFTIEYPSDRVFTANGDAEAGFQGIDVTASPAEITVDGFFPVATTSRNLLTTNGTVHVVDNIVLPRLYTIDAINHDALIGDVDLSDGLVGPVNSTNFLMAMSTALANTTLDVDSIFRSEEEYSVLAPINPDALPADTMVLRHTFAGRVSLADAEGTKITSIGDHEYYVTEAVNGLVYVNGRSRIAVVQDAFNAPGNNTSLIEDYNAYNGLVTFMIAPFTPLPAQNTTSILADNPDFTTFASILDSLELGNLADVTYLAVPNDILDPIAADFDLSDEDDRADLLEVINGHIITTVFFSNQLETGLTYTDRNGNDVDLRTTIEAGAETEVGIRNEEEGVITVIPFSDEATELNVLSSNGVIHAIAGVRSLPE